MKMDIYVASMVYSALSDPTRLRVLQRVDGKLANRPSLPRPSRSPPPRLATMSSVSVKPGFSMYVEMGADMFPFGSVTDGASWDTSSAERLGS